MCGQCDDAARKDDERAMLQAEGMRLAEQMEAVKALPGGAAFVSGLLLATASKAGLALADKAEVEAYLHGQSLAEAKLATWMTANGFATGHGDNLDALLKELEWQVDEMREKLSHYRRAMDAISASGNLK